ncbi:MAG: response regulator [Desulfovibrionaceae bacterium]
MVTAVSISPLRNKVLIVDKDAGTCEILASILIGNGFEPIAYLHPGKVLDDPEGTEFLLAFIDVRLPEISGLDLAAMLKRQNRLEEVVFMSSSGSVDHPIQAIKIGAYDYLKKPFSVSELEMLVTRFKERLTLRQKVRVAEDRRIALIQNLPLLLFTLHPDFSLEFVNHACQAMLGYTPHEAMATPGWFMDRVHPHDRESIGRAFDRSFEQGRPVAAECRLLHRKGQVLHGIMRTLPSAGTCPECVEGIFVDITDRVFLERSLVQNEKLKTLGAISAEVAHEIRNPLMSIAGFARRLERRYPNSMEIGIVLRESQRLEKLLGRIIDYLKPVDTVQRECTVNAILADALSLLFPELDDKGVWCQLDVEDGLPPVVADAHTLEQVCINIIRSGLPLLARGDVLTIKTFQGGRTVHMEFRRPLHPDEQTDPDRLFLPFEEGGVDIGLPLCHRLVKNMGGILTFAVDAGQAVFMLTVPMVGGEGEDETLAARRERHDENRPCFAPGVDALLRERFDDLFERRLRAANSARTPLSLILAGTDAHASPDHAATVGGVLAAALPHPWHLLVAYAPQEYAVLLPDTDHVEAMATAKRLMLALVKAAALAEPVLGVATLIPGVDTTTEDMIAAASQALTEARQHGAGAIRHVFAEPQPER